MGFLDEIIAILEAESIMKLIYFTLPLPEDIVRLITQTVDHRRILRYITPIESEVTGVSGVMKLNMDPRTSAPSLLTTKLPLVLQSISAEMAPLPLPIKIK